MRCPNGDNILEPHAPHQDGISLHYLLCPTCGGIWLSSFDANYLRAIDLPEEPTLASKGETLRGCLCPQCRQILAAATGDNIPPEVTIFRCPDGHGYFFPAGELAKFKEAQEAKITYHQRWHIPLASVASAMLMTFFGLALSAGLLLGVIEGQRQQTITSQATETIISQKAYVDAASRSGVTIIALTTEKVLLTVIVDGKEYPMLAPDGLSHVVRISGLAPGEHTYFFRFTKEGRALRSTPYSFSSF